MVICIDIDGTLTEPFYYLKRANDYFGMCLLPEDVRHYDVHLNYGIPRRMYLEFYERFGERIHFEASPRTGAAGIVGYLAETHDIHYVTARTVDMTSVSRAWLKFNGFPMGGLHCLGSHRKVEQARALGCDVFIEDRFENARELAEAGMAVLLMDCPYNQGTIPGVRRVHDWREAEVCIREMEADGKPLRIA